MAGAGIEEIRPGQICVVAKGDPGGHPEKVIGPPGLRRPSRWGDASAYCSNTSLTKGPPIAAPFRQSSNRLTNLKGSSELAPIRRVRRSGEVVGA